MQRGTGAASALPEAWEGHPEAFPAAPSRLPQPFKSDGHVHAVHQMPLAQTPGGGGPGHGVQHGQRAPEPLGGGSGSAPLLPIPQGVLNTPCMISKHFCRKARACLLLCPFALISKVKEHPCPSPSKATTLNPDGLAPGRRASGAVGGQGSASAGVKGQKAAWRILRALGQMYWDPNPSSPRLGASHRPPSEVSSPHL